MAGATVSRSTPCECCAAQDGPRVLAWPRAGCASVVTVDQDTLARLPGGHRSGIVLQTPPPGNGVPGPAPGGRIPLPPGLWFATGETHGDNEAECNRGASERVAEWQSVEYYRWSRAGGIPLVGRCFDVPQAWLCTCALTACDS